MSNDEYVKSEWIVEHNWVCNHCKHSNPGREDKCINCGKPIDDSHQEIIPEDLSKNNAVKEQELIDRFKNGPDWICEYCKHRNQADNIECVECGASKLKSGNEVKETKVAAKKPAATKPGKKLHSPKPSTNSSPYREPSFQSTPKQKNNLAYYGKIIAIAAFSLLLLFGIKSCYTYFYSWMPTIATIAETKWSYSVVVRQREIRSGNDWESNMPPHSFNTSCARQIRQYHNCNPYSCNPHRESYQVCRTIRECSPRESCRTVCSSNRNRSSTCREICRTVNDCRNREECSTRYRMVTDTCYQRCPDYENFCSFSYPFWRQQNQATNTEINSINIRRPSIANNLPLCGNDPESNVWEASHSETCYTANQEFLITFTVQNNIPYLIRPSTEGDFLTYRFGQVWNAQYNRAGGFQVLNRLP